MTTVNITALPGVISLSGFGARLRVALRLAIVIFAGLWIPAGAVILSAGDVIVLETNPDSLVRVKPGRYDPGDKGANQVVITQGNLISSPDDVAIGDGVLYVTDRTNNTIIKVDTATGNQSLLDAVVGGVPIGSGFKPRGIAIDSRGKLVVADSGVARVIEVDPDTGEALPIIPDFLMDDR